MSAKNCKNAFYDSQRDYVVHRRQRQKPTANEQQKKHLFIQHLLPFRGKRKWQESGVRKDLKRYHWTSQKYRWKWRKTVNCYCFERVKKWKLMKLHLFMSAMLSYGFTSIFKNRMSLISLKGKSLFKALLSKTKTESISKWLLFSVLTISTFIPIQ